MAAHQGGATHISVDITHSSYPGRRFAELRLPLGAPISEVKDLLYRKTGTSPSSMELYLVDSTQGGSKTLLHDSETLAYYACATGSQLHINDISANSGMKVDDSAELDDPSTKYVISEETYAKRGTNMRKFLKEMRDKAKHVNHEAKDQKLAASSANQVLEEVMEAYPLGSRCSVGPGDKRGVVKIVRRDTTIARKLRLMKYEDDHDKSRLKQDIIIGVALDEPLGNTDGREDNLTLFDCKGPRYGIWSFPQFVSVGDYPELDPFDMDEI